MPAPEHIILFGGSFDPPHLAHVRLSQQARLAWAADNAIDPACTLLAYIPAARSPHKATAPHATDAQRLEMLDLALGPALADAAAPAAIWPVELERAAAAAGPSYTIDTVTTLRGQLDAQGKGLVRLHLLIGADQLAALHRWHRARELVAAAPPIVMFRPPYEQPEPLAQALLDTGAWSPTDLALLLSALVTSSISASSTAARAAAAAEDFASLEAIVGPAVAGYIRLHGLYLAKLGILGAGPGAGPAAGPGGNP